jgi:hypothetical protein
VRAVRQELLGLCERPIPMTMGRGKHGKWSAADKFLMVLCLREALRNSGQARRHIPLIYQMRSGRRILADHVALEWGVCVFNSSTGTLALAQRSRSDLGRAQVSHDSNLLSAERPLGSRWAFNA